MPPNVSTPRPRAPWHVLFGVSGSSAGATELQDLSFGFLGFCETCLKTFGFEIIIDPQEVAKIV